MLTERQIAYHQYLKSDHWKCLRAGAIDVWGCRCNACESIANIEVHHLNYHNLLDVTPNDLMPLCAGCHEDIHKSEIMREYLKSDAPSDEKRIRTKDYLAGVFETKKRAAENRKKLAQVKAPKISELKFHKKMKHAKKRRKHVIQWLREQGYSYDNIQGLDDIKLLQLANRFNHSPFRPVRKPYHKFYR